MVVGSFVELKASVKKDFIFVLVVQLKIVNLVSVEMKSIENCLSRPTNNRQPPLNRATTSDLPNFLVTSLL